MFLLATFSDTLGELISGHWVKILFLLIGAALSLVWKYYWDRRLWKKRQGVETLHLSSNTIQYRKTEETRTTEDGETETEQITLPWLFLDCIFEDNLANKVSNRYVRQLIRRAISKTTIEQPFMHFGDTDDDHWFVMNMLRMGIAEIKGGDSLEKLSGTALAPVRDVRCVFAVTYERWVGMRQGKIRIMLARESDVVEDKFSQDFQFQDPHHVDRPKTMIQMTLDYNDAQKYTMMLRIPIRNT